MRATIPIQIGSAVSPPVDFGPMLFLASCPTQTPIVCFGVTPMNHASVWSFVVPVFPAMRRPRAFARAAVPRSVDSFEHLQHHVGGGRRGRLLRVGRVLLEEDPFGVADPLDEPRGVEEALVREDRVGGRHLHRRHLERPERERRIGEEVLADAEAAGGLDHLPRPDEEVDADRRDVDRVLEGVLVREDSAVLPGVVLRPPRSLARVDRDRDRRVEDGVGGGEARLDGGHVDDRFERRSDLAERLDGPVELRAGEVVAADEGADGARAVFEDDHGAFQDRLLRDDRLFLSAVVHEPLEEDEVPSPHGLSPGSRRA